MQIATPTPLSNTVAPVWKTELLTVFDEAPVGMMLTALDGTLLHVNRALRQLLDIHHADLAGTRLADYLHPDDAAAANTHYWLLATGDLRQYRAETRLRRLDGTELWALISASAVYDGAGSPAFLIVHIHDVTEQRTMEDRLRHRALHDSLTGLPNRTHFADQLEAALIDARRREETVGVLLLDLDGFKSVNDTYGHEGGDQVLREVGRRLGSCLRGGDIASRFGGDEFALLVQRAQSPTGADTVAARVLDALSEPIDLGARGVSISASIGITYGWLGRPGVDDLLREADDALYAAKRAGRARYAVFHRTSDDAPPPRATTRPGEPTPIRPRALKPPHDLARR